MANVLIVHAHPEPRSFNTALTETAANALRRDGHEVTVSDLYARNFDPVAGRHDFLTQADPEIFHYQAEQANAAATGTFAPELAAEHACLMRADVLILQFPIWWGQPPAILKGWFDRVLAYGIAYVDGRRFTSGLMRGRRALMGVTTGGTPDRFSSDGVYGTIEQVLWPVRRLTLEYMGYTVETPFVSYAAPRVGAPERQAYLAAWQARVQEVAAKPVTATPLDPRAAVDSAGTAAWQQQR